MRKAAGKLEAELAGLREQIEARIQELTRTWAEAVLVSIGKSIVSLEEDRKETEPGGARFLPSPNISVRRERRVVSSGCESRPATVAPAGST
jgi:hypothetical protein